MDPVELTDLVNRAVADGPVALPDVLGRLDEAYLAHVIVLWSLALKQPGTAPTTTEIVRFQSLEGDDRIIEIPALMFSEPIPTADILIDEV